MVPMETEVVWGDRRRWVRPVEIATVIMVSDLPLSFLCFSGDKQHLWPKWSYLFQFHVTHVQIQRRRSSDQTLVSFDGVC
ncbi:hypothetical protein HanXRQr2_Chr13g0572231 [Helianthus annuus]|uniref:Uncharacterized protein n=1 Tax=Helianthus annuus TaxID=4232 RepID=A0A251SP50_HELAN|nr:hypothetical protein HanXRQr2_Chr13g0572231 [Helianthus annuus]KAJ0496520.1 hypothetical protein HanHA89_Chr13g0500741 [Helianthus annuus]